MYRLMPGQLLRNIDLEMGRHVYLYTLPDEKMSSTQTHNWTQPKKGGSRTARKRISTHVAAA